MAGQGKQLGGCLCGAVRYELDSSTVLSAGHCHCRDCQRSTGSGFATFLIVPEAAFELTAGEVRSFAVTAESGRTVTRSFCPACGSPIMSNSSMAPSLVLVKAGSLDDASWVVPDSGYWGSSAQPWAPPDPRLDVHDKNPM